MSEAALKNGAPIRSFFLRLVGKSPEQLEARKEFEENLQKVEDQGNVLDGILDDIDKIHDSAKKTSKKNKALHETLTGISLSSIPAADPK